MIRKWELIEPRKMPSETKVIHVGEQYGIVTVWTRDVVGIVDDYELAIFGTGMTPPSRSDHVGTVQMPNSLVWHVFRRNL